MTSVQMGSYSCMKESFVLKVVYMEYSGWVTGIAA